MKDIKKKESKNLPFLIYPNDSYKSKWDILVIICAVYNSFQIPFDVAFKPEILSSPFFKIIDFVIDSIFLLDMIITFRLVYINEKGDEETNLRNIASNYFRTMFWIDLSATLPLDTILQWIFDNDNPYYQAFGLLKLGRVMRLNKIISFVQVENDIKSVL